MSWTEIMLSRRTCKKSLCGWIFLGLLSIIVSIPLHAALALNECAECVERKKPMCSQECLLVSPERSIKCQDDCVRQYCRHRCSPGDPALSGLANPVCTDCLDRQYNLCESECPTGADRLRAVCKIDCANKRCKDNCPAGRKTHAAQ